jgi:uncharacterized membrane protein YoaK (UPF0700 family)
MRNRTRGQRPSFIGPSSAAERRDALVITLTLATGSLDVIGFTRLGGVFTSVMTGNVALLGLAAGSRNADLALHTGVAFLGYIVGVGVGTRLASRPHFDQSVWPRRVTLALVVEFLALVVFCCGWEISKHSPAGDSQLALLSLASAAMGIQSAAVVRLGIPGLSSTYLTGTLTEVVATLVTRRQADAQAGRGLLALAALALGAGVGGLLVFGAPWAAPLWSLVVVGTVLVASARLFRSGAGSGADPRPRG